MAKKPSKAPVQPAVPDIAPRFPYPAVLTICALWAVIVLANYKTKMGFFAIDAFAAPLWLANLAEASRAVSYLPQMAYAALFALFALSAGGIILNAAAGAENAEIGDPDWFFFALGLGFGTLALLTLALGFLGLYNKCAVFVLLGFGVLAGVLRFNEDFRVRLERTIIEFGKLRFTWFDRLLLFLLFLYSATAFVWCLSPEIFFDSLVYHLGAPNYYIREGRIASMPSNICSGFPLLVQMLYTAGLIVSDDILTKLLHFSLGLFLAGTLFSAGRRYVSTTAGLLACAFFFSIPMVVLNLTTSGMDVGSCWFTFLAAYALALFSARERGTEEKIADGTLLLGGIFTGFACGTKYQALFTVFAGFGVLIYRHFTAAVRKEAWPAVGQALFYGIVSGLVFAPWPLKNVLFHGNPLYPFMGKLFGGQQVDPYKWFMLLSDGFSRSAQYTFASRENFREFLFHPWYLTFKGMGNADFVGPFVLICLPLFLLFRLRRPAFRHLAVFALVMWVSWWFSTSMPRFFLQGLTVLSLIFAVLIAGSGNKAFRYLFQALLVVLSWYGLAWLNRIEASQDAWRVVFGLQDREEYLGRQHSTYPSAYYPAMKYINTALPPESRVLFAGETRGYYCERRFIAPSVNDVHTLVLFARESGTPEEMQAKIAAAGITHIFLNLAEAMRLDKSYRLFQWDAVSIRVFNAWWDRYARLVWNDVRTTGEEYLMLFVYSVAGGPSAVPPPPHNYFNDLYLKSLQTGN